MSLSKLCYRGVYPPTISRRISCLPMLLLHAALLGRVALIMLLLLYYCHEETQAFSLIAHLHGSKTPRRSSSSSSSPFVTSPISTAHDGVRRYLSSTKRNEARSSINNNSNSNNHRDEEDTAGVRLNKAFMATHSRRQADRLIQEGRVCVNGEIPTTMGARLFPGDVVTLDNERVYWEHHPTMSRNNGGGGNSTDDSTTTTTTTNHHHHNGNSRHGHDAQTQRQPRPPLQHHTYIKYWKPRGVECTTDRRVRNNIIDALGEIPGVKHRLWPMGRLDKDSTGLILLTSDGTTTQRVLKSSSTGTGNNDDSGSRRRHWKTYWVETDKRATDQDLEKLSRGVRILAPTSRDGNNKIQWVTTRTDATITRRIPSIKAAQGDNQENNNNNNGRLRNHNNQLVFTICEGKNRQIRRMCETVGLTVVRLHRVEFAGITLDHCPRPGTWAFLTKKELDRLLLLQEDDDDDDKE